MISQRGLWNPWKGNDYKYELGTLINKVVVYIAGVPVHSIIRYFFRALEGQDKKTSR